MVDEKVEPICPVCGSPVSFEIDGDVDVASCSNRNCLAFFIEGESEARDERVCAVEAYNDFVASCMKEEFVLSKISEEMAKRCGEAVASHQDDMFSGNAKCPSCGGAMQCGITFGEAVVQCSECHSSERVKEWREGRTYHEALWNVVALGKAIASITDNGWGGEPS